MRRVPKITIVGAGGYVFPTRLTVDILSYPELQDCVLHLYDINPATLGKTRRNVDRIVEKNRLPTRLESGTNRRRALAGADYVIVAFQVGGVEAYAHDVNIPRRYGLDQCVGDTLGPGGVFRGLRSIGALATIARDMKQFCPDALMIQYANPMAMNCWATSLLGIRTVGLCHSVQGTTWMLSDRLGVPYADVTFRCGGINHQAWITEFRHEGRDVYPQLREVMLRQNPSPAALRGRSAGPRSRFAQRGLDHSIKDDVYYHETVRTELLRTFGFFHTESSHHGSEYTPWFRKDAKTIKAYIRKRWDYYQICCSYKEAKHQGYLKDLVEAPLKLSEEYGARIIHGMETGTKHVIYGNVPNWGRPGTLPGESDARLITNLPRTCCVEVACLVDRNGVQPTLFGELPPQCAAVNRTNINVQGLAVEAALTGNRERVHQAVAMDPLTGALMTLPKIRSMVDEMFRAERRWLPQFKEAS